MDDEAVAVLVHSEASVGSPAVQQTISHSVTHLLFDGVPHRPGTQLWMEPLSDEEREDGRIQSKPMAAFCEEGHLSGQKFFGDLQLVFVRETVEDQLLSDPRKDFGPEGLLGSGQDMPFESGLTGMLEAHEFGGADV